MGLYDHFETNSDEEIKGVVVEPNETTRITISRAGGANKEYEKLLDKVSKKNRHKIKMHPKFIILICFNECDCSLSVINIK